jgi:hypothetical protein
VINQGCQKLAEKSKAV